MTDPVVHQAFFGWAGGHTIIASSFEEERDKDMWRSRLEDQVRLNKVYRSEPPPSALSYLTFDDGRAAVIRRVQEGHSGGRTNAHALIGPAECLDVSLALGLAAWPDWKSTVKLGQWLPTLAAKYLRTTADTDAALRSRAEQLERELVMVAASALAEPRLPLSIIGCPEDSRLAMVWALRAAVGDALPWRWSFTTYSDRHADSVKNLPEIVFLPEIPGDGVASRTVVNLTKEPVGNHLTEYAGQLVAGLLHGTPIAPPVSSKRPDHSDHTVQFRTELAPVGPAPESAPNMRTHPNTSHAGKRKLTWAESMLAATSADTLLHHLSAQSTIDDRARLRQELDIDSVNRLAEFVEFNARNELLDKMLTAMYGPEGTDLRNHDAGEHAWKLVENSRSERLSSILAGRAINQGRNDIADTAFWRWAAADPKSAPHHLAWPARRWRRTRRNPYFPFIAWVAVLAVLAAVFLAGVLVGHPTQPTPQPVAASANPTTPAPVPPAQQPPPAETPAGVVTVQTQMDPNYDMYAFVKSGDSYYPQAICASADTANLAYRCSKHYDPPEKTRVVPSLVGIPVPRSQLEQLNQEAQAKRPVRASKEKEWGKEYVVR